MSKYPELPPFTKAFADAYRGFMKEHRITGSALTKKLGRALGYVSERVNGKRALDTEDVDALALLAGGGWTGKSLMIELVRRAEEQKNPAGELIEVGSPPLLRRMAQTNWHAFCLSWVSGWMSRSLTAQ